MSMQLQLALRQRKPRKRNEDDNVQHTFVCIMRGNARPRPRTYKGLYADAKKAAWDWLDENPAIKQIVTEDGEVVAERG